MNKYVIIVAGGKGLRMGGEVPKQFLPVAGMPILMHTIRMFKSYCSSMGIVLVLPKDQHEYWNALCKEHHFDIHCTIAEGGKTRFHSVKNGLSCINGGNTDLVAVHDGVRPFASREVIDRCFTAAATCGAVVPVVPVVETLRHINSDGTSTTVSRNDYRLVQTPQTFSLQLLKQAYAQPFSDAFTDDASVVEAMGHAISLVDGNRENIKITTPADMTMAEVLAGKA